jgi:hypothetical protein
MVRGCNDMPFGRPTPGRPTGRPPGLLVGFSYYYLVIIFYNIVPLIMEFTHNQPGVGQDRVVPSGAFFVTL